MDVLCVEIMLHLLHSPWKAGLIGFTLSHSRSHVHLIRNVFFCWVLFCCLVFFMILLIVSMVTVLHDFVERWGDSSIFFSWFCLWGQGFSFIYLEKTNWAEKGNLFTSPLWLFWLLQYRQKLFGDVWVFSLCVLVSIYVAPHITKYVYWCQYKRGFKFLLDFCAEPNDNRLCKKLVLDYCMLHIEMPIRI